MEPIRNSNYNESDIAAALISDVKKDLHIHTCFSDGELTPEEVIDRWSAEGFKLIAITDHDGIDGSIEGMKYASGKDIRFISGIEFDSADDLSVDVHMLGYGFDYSCPVMQEALADIIMHRDRRNSEMMAALNNMGYNITPEDVFEVNQGRYVGKPTFASVLHRKGYISDPQIAFTTVFREPSIRRIRKKTLQSREVIDLIHAAGGLAVLAHPIEQRHLYETYEDFVPRLQEILDTMTFYGIDGIECFHPSADEYQQEVLCEYAAKHDLLMTRGSDFHRDSNPRDFTRYHMP